MDIGDSFQEATDSFFAFLPNVLGFLIILLIGYIVAKVVAGIVRKALRGLGLDDKLRESPAHEQVERFMPGASPSNGIARVVFWLIFVFFLFSAVGALKVPALTGFMNSVLTYLPNVIVAIVIFVIAALISGAVAGAATKVMGDTPTGKIIAAVVPALVMVIAMFMILEQLEIAPEIIRIAFAATMGALALGLALAFGLGGRDVAARILEDAYQSGREHKEQARRDLETGKERAKDEASRVQDSASGPRTSTHTGSNTGTSLRSVHDTDG